MSDHPDDGRLAELWVAAERVLDCVHYDDAGVLDIPRCDMVRLGEEIRELAMTLANLESDAQAHYERVRQEALEEAARDADAHEDEVASYRIRLLARKKRVQGMKE